MANRDGKYYDIEHGIASASITAGKTIIATTGADYHGISVIAGATAQATVRIFDSISASTGSIIDIFLVDANRNIWIDRFIPVKAKVGLVTSITGVGANGAIFYSPKG